MVGAAWARLTGALLLLVGCASNAPLSSGAAVSAGTLPAGGGTASGGASERLSVRVTMGTDANGGGALHVLVRQTTKGDYPRLEYEDVAKLLTAESDPDTLDWLVAVPGSERSTTVVWPKDGAIAVYFLFSNPGYHWRYLVEPDPGEVEFRIEGNESVLRCVSSHAGLCP